MVYIAPDGQVFLVLQNRTSVCNMIRLRERVPIKRSTSARQGAVSKRNWIVIWQKTWLLLMHHSLNQNRFKRIVSYHIYIFVGASGQALGASLHYGFSLGDRDLLPAFLPEVLIHLWFVHKSMHCWSAYINQSSVWLTHQALERVRAGRLLTTGTPGVEDLPLGADQEG